jgi:hypothetical protein
VKAKTACADVGVHLGSQACHGRLFLNPEQ